VTGPPLVSIIIVNYKDYTYLYQYLNSLARTTYPNIEIIVVDNDSDVTMLRKLKDEYKQVNFFPLKENLDYVEGSNHKTRVMVYILSAKIFRSRSNASTPTQGR
jgi:GT2 family glycosyltransferase